MKRILCAAVMAAVFATPAFAANVYLKDGSVIQAKKVWREGGKVHVLATRHTLTSFEPCEVELKRTFVKRHRSARRVAAVQPQAQATAAAPNGAAAIQKTGVKKTAIKLSALPKLPEKSAESLVPSSGGSGNIRQHKKEMAEKIGE